MLTPVNSRLAAIAVIAALAACEHVATPADDAGPTHTMAPPVTVTVPATLDVGKDPALPWLDADTLHLGNRTITLAGEFDNVAVTDHHIVTGTVSDTATVDIRDRTGKVLRTESNGWGSFAVNTEGSAVAWQESRDGMVVPVVLGGAASKPTRLSPIDVGSTGATLALIGAECPDKCSVYVKPSDVAGPPVVVRTGQAPTDLVLPSMDDSVIDVGSDRSLLLDHADENGPCLSRLAASGARPTWKDCTSAGISLSPNASLVLATPLTEEPGEPTSRLRVLDASSGRRVLTVKGGGAMFHATRWEDNSHVLAILERHGLWSMVRVGLDGSLEQATHTVKAETNPFTLCP